MGRKGLQGRGNWQDPGGKKATKAEKDFFTVFEKAFRNTPLEIVSKPKEFSNIYVDVQLTPEVLSEIYNPVEGITRHGISPDYAIYNKATKKTLYVEVKRQDGWVEGKKRSAGRGNAHERSNKYFTPGLLAAMRAEGKLGARVLPFWTVFIGDITRDPCRVREITLWYKGCEDHFFFWRPPNDEKVLLKHFDERLRRLLN